MNPDEIRMLVAARLEQADTALSDACFLQANERSSQGVVNRAYYAMFYAALALLQTIGQTPAKHAGVMALIDREFVHPGHLPKQFSKDFHWVFEARQAGDYRVLGAISPERARKALEAARSFLDGTRAYLTKTGWLPPRPRARSRAPVG